MKWKSDVTLKSLRLVWQVSYEFERLSLCFLLLLPGIYLARHPQQAN